MPMWKSGISVFLVSAETGAGVNKKTNITYEQKEKRTLLEKYLHAIFKPVGSATSIFKADIKKPAAQYT